MRLGARRGSLVSLALLGARGCASMRCVVGCEGSARPSALTSKEWLLEQPAGAYTTARTCSGGRRLFEWDMHVERTASSAASMLKSGAAPPPALLAAVGDADALRPRLDATVAAAVHEYLGGAEVPGELKVTVLVSWAAGGASESTVACHVGPLPPLPAPPVRVEVRGAPRANAAAKDSSWVAERAPLEALLRDDFNELLLLSEGGALLEGSQTNFYALIDGALHTAEEGILAGTVRRLLLEVCEREGIPVVREPPRLADAAAWDAAFVSSTSRLLLPIDELYVPQPGAPSEAADRVAAWANGPGTLAARLQALVLGEVVAHSTEVLPRRA